AHRAGEPPAQRVVAEQRLAYRDQLLAHRRMHHQPVARVVLDPVVVQDLPGLRGVVLLVEDRGAGVGRRAQVEEPGQGGQRGDHGGHRPALQSVDRTEIGHRHQRAGTDDRDRPLRDDGVGGGGGHSCDRRLCGMAPGRLLIGATPLGQPNDASARLIEALATADVVAAEDTRRVRTLAQLLDVTPAGRVVSLYDQNEASRVPGLIGQIADGATVLLVSDAGMPLINDPGYRLVTACIEADLPVTCLPGPSAVTTALAVSGLPADRFCFEGFAPRRQAARRSWLRTLADEPRTCVFFE